MEDHDKGKETDEALRPELQEQFEEWRRGHASLDSLDSSGATLDGEAALRAVRRTRQIRWFTLLVVATLSGMGIWGSRMDIAYFFSPSEAVSMGDLRVQYVEGNQELAAGSNRYVEAEGLIATLIHDAAHHQYFFCPLYNILVRTPNPVRLPLNKTFHELDAVDGKLLHGQVAMVWELAVDVSARGRLIALSDLPSRWQSIWRHFAPDTEGVDASQVMVLIDGGRTDEERPGSYLRHVLVGFVSLLILLGSVFFYRRARREEAALVEVLGRGDGAI